MLAAAAAFGDDPPRPGEVDLPALPAADPTIDGPTFPVSRFVVQYADDATDMVPLDQLLPVDVTLGRTASGYAAPRRGLASQTVPVPGGDDTVQRYHASAIAAVTGGVLGAYRERGLLGVTVAPHPADLDLRNEKDLRRPGDTTLRLVVATARVTELRTVGFGGRLPDSWRVDNKAHRRIREGSPLQPAKSAREGTTDLLQRDELDDYLFRLNRHPGRQVEAALSPSEDGRGVALDYRVNESRPWFAYAQASNTGTIETAEWQTRMGFVHRQATNRDDIFSLDYLNAGGDDVNAISGGYEAPWFSRQRPSWLQSHEDESPWVSWIPRDKIPWPGADRLRWRIAGSWSRILAGLDEAVAGTDQFEDREWDLSGEFIYNTWQQRALFVDLFAGVQLRHLEVENLVRTRTEALLALPRGGVRVERLNAYSTFLADVGAEGNVNTIPDDEAALLGRIDPDPRWALILWDVQGSHFLEPLLFRKSWEDPSSPGSSKLAHEVFLGTRGQYAFDYRLIPQASMVVGGLYSVRGYPQSAAVGDTVVTGTVEYRYHLARSLPISRKPVKVPFLGSFRLAPQQVYGAADWDLILSAFFDAGHTIRNDVAPNSAERDQTLLGAGLGAELQLLGRVRARFDWGRALRSTATGSGNATEKGDDEFYFYIGVVF